MAWAPVILKNGLMDCPVAPVRLHACLRDESMSVFLTVLMTLFSAFLLTMTYCGGRRMCYSLLDCSRNSLLWPRSLLARLLLLR